MKSLKRSCNLQDINLIEMFSNRMGKMSWSAIPSNLGLCSYRVIQYRYPFTLPFSKVFPTCCRDVSIFVHQFYQFAEGFSQTHGEMDEILKKVWATPCIYGWMQVANCSTNIIS
jgi:hypothetical protein